jgi:hypothetical protein
MGRRKQWTENILARFRTGTVDRMDALLDPDETRLDLIREAVRRELRRRTRKREKKQDEEWISDAEFNALTPEQQHAYMLEKNPLLGMTVEQGRAALAPLLEAEKRLEEAKAKRRALKKAASPHISQVSRCGGWVRAGGWFRTWPARVPAAVGGWAGSTMVSLVAGLVESRSQAAAALRNRA